MKDTSCGENCPFYKQGFCASERECPNYMESVWIEGATQEHRIIKDCSPKRMLIQNQRLENRLEHLEAALQKSTSEYQQLSSYLVQLISASKTVLEKTERMVTYEEKNVLLDGDGSISI